MSTSSGSASARPGALADMTGDRLTEAAKAAAAVAASPGAQAWQLAAKLGWSDKRTGRALASARKLGTIRCGDGGWWPAGTGG